VKNRIREAIRSTRSMGVACLMALCSPVFSQTNTFHVHSEAELRRKESALMRIAVKSTTGEAGEKLDDEGSHWLLLMSRARTGESELHNLWADEILVRSGQLTLVVGGEMTGTHPYNNLPGEFHGSGLAGGVVRTLGPGDVAFIPAGIPHWMKVDSGKRVTVLIFKEKGGAE
jgi:hypothetical protein